MSEYCANPPCTGVLASSTDGTYPRPATFSLLKCATCGEYMVKHTSGRIYTLRNPLDPDSEAGAVKR